MRYRGCIMQVNRRSVQRLVCMYDCCSRGSTAAAFTHAALFPAVAGRYLESDHRRNGVRANFICPRIYEPLDRNLLCVLEFLLLLLLALFVIALCNSSCGSELQVQLLVQLHLMANLMSSLIS